MQVAVAGATGHIGALTAAALERDAHDVVRISRSLGGDLLVSNGLDEALAGVEALVDAHECDGDRSRRGGGLLRHHHPQPARRRAAGGVRHHLLLSIVGIHRVEGNAHYAGKREQERLVQAGSVPWTIVPATQFHDFAAMVTSWTERNGVATIAPLLVQPIAPADIADVLAEVATGEPQGRYPDVAGPETQDLVDMGAAHQRGARPPGPACPHMVGPVRHVDGRHVDGRRRAAARRACTYRAHHVRRVAGRRRGAVSGDRHLDIGDGNLLWW